MKCPFCCFATNTKLCPPWRDTASTGTTAICLVLQIIWSTKQMAVVPVLAVSRQGGQSFVFVAKQQNGHFMAVQTAVTLGDTVGNTYSITSGLNVGDRVIVSGTQFLVNGMPVMLMGG